MTSGPHSEIEQEITRQDEKHGRSFNGDSALGRIRLGVACVEDETRELVQAWRDDRREAWWEETRTEALQVAAVALRLVRQIDRERCP